MNEQPEALRWAAILEHQAQYAGAADYKHKAAAELRRLHAENERLTAEIERLREACAKVCDEIEEGYHRREGKKRPEERSDAETGAGQCAYAIRALQETPR